MSRNWNGVDLGHLRHYDSGTKQAILRQSTPELEADVAAALRRTNYQWEKPKND